MARAVVLAAGGIVLRQEETPLIAVVRLRKRNEWVLPKGKLADGETPRAAAEREVLEETGHEVAVHEFLGTLVYESGGRSKVVHYWRMEPRGEQTHDLMNDVRAVDWLPLEAAVERLSRGYERVFLENVGPLALEAAALARPARRPRATQPVIEKRRSRRVAATTPSFTEPVPISPPPDREISATGQDAGQCAPGDVVEAEPRVQSTALDMASAFVETDSATPAVEREFSNNNAVVTARAQRRNLVDRVRDWLRRAA